PHQAPLGDPRLERRAELPRAADHQDGHGNTQVGAVRDTRRSQGERPSRLLHALLRRLQGQAVEGADGPLRRPRDGSVVPDPRSGREGGPPPGLSSRGYLSWPLLIFPKFQLGRFGPEPYCTVSESPSLSCANSSAVRVKVTVDVSPLCG